MIHAVVLISLLLAHSGYSEPAGQNCSAALTCYTLLRKQILEKINELPRPDQEGADSFAEYRRFCGLIFPPVSPCAVQGSFKNCTTHPDIKKREQVYTQLRDFVCAGNEKDWKRFRAIMYAQVSDPCKGAIKATENVLKNDTAKCGSVRQLFSECAAQQRLPADVLEPGMELLGCKDLQPRPPTSPSPGTQPHAQPDCKVEDVWGCLERQAVLLASGLGLGKGNLVSEEETCADQETCLDVQLLGGCSSSDTDGLPVRQAAVNAVINAACENGRAILKSIRSAASCFDADIFRRCLDKSDIKVGNPPSKEQCDSAFMKTNKCIGESSKSCFQADHVKNANKLVAAYLENFGCASENTSSNSGSSISGGVDGKSGLPTQKPDQKNGKGNGSGLVSTSTLAISVGLAAAFALWR